ncbi:response regulator transcription factor [uncultured Gemmiger sp.]|uniref:response regulator transcription factor n=1 Tax=uncultured Gemmiger sp. TaxID=1623490 RepID=UPI0025D59DAA|nr:response regulator transcription factor [uncultured Gemmiger sp.]
MRVLLVEDETALQEALRDILNANRYTVDCCETGTDALDLMCSGSYDLVLLDRMLPGLDGLSVLRQARDAGVHTPVLMLTALDAVGDRVAGLDAGADDYLPKPFATEELLARIRALCRRPAELEPNESLCRGDLTLQPKLRLLTGPAGTHSLSGRECAMLELLMRNAGSVVSRERILLHVWGPDSEVESGNIDNYIHLVRRRLKLVGSHTVLQTRRGAGYCLEVPVC